MPLSEMLEKRTAHSINDYKPLSDQDLVEACKNQNVERIAWEEFFYRFIPVIKRAIKSQLFKSGYINLYRNEEVLGNIHEKVVITLYSKGALQRCTKPEGINSWLIKIAVNKTRDWLKEQNRIKKLPKKHFETTCLSLSAPLYNDSTLTLEDKIENNTDTIAISEKGLFKKDIGSKINNIQQQLRIPDQQKYWIFRLNLLSILPFSSQEIHDLSKFRRISSEEIKSNLFHLSETLDKKEEKRIELLGKSVLYWHEILNMEYKISQMIKEDKPDNQQIEEIRKDIIKKNKKRVDILKTCSHYSRPSNKEIALLTAFPQEQAKQISNILLRIRSKLLQNRLSINASILRGIL